MGAIIVGIASISVIIPCYRCSDFLNRAVDSVIHQTLLPCEIILINDASDDDGKTQTCIDGIIDNHHHLIGIHFVSHKLDKNIGPGAARNIGWNVAKGEYLAFLDSDDAWLPDKLSIQYKWMLEHPDYVMSCHNSLDSIMTREKKNNLKIVKFKKIFRLSLLMRNSIQTRTVMIKNLSSSRFPSSMWYAEDYHLWLNLICSGYDIAWLDLPLAVTYPYEPFVTSLSSNLREMHLGVLVCYSNLKDQNYINSYEYNFVNFLEKCKYFIRKILFRIKTIR